MKRWAALGVGLSISAFSALAWAEGDDATETTEKSVPQIYELVPNLSPDPPNADEILRVPDQQYPTAGDILRAMREIPPLDPPRLHPPEEQDAPDAGPRK